MNLLKIISYQDIVFYNDEEEENFNVEVLIKDEDVCLDTKIVSHSFKSQAVDVIKNWLRNRNTLDFFGTGTII